MINLAIYLRVSTAQQTYNRQEQDIRDYISRIYKKMNTILKFMLKTSLDLKTLKIDQNYYDF